MGNLFEEILKGALGGDGSILGDILKNAGAGQQQEAAAETEETTVTNEANIPKAGGNNNPFDIGDELDDIANGRNQGTTTSSAEAEEVGIPSMGGIDIGDILKKIIVGGSAIPAAKEEEVEEQQPQASTQGIDIGDILGKLGLGLGSSGSSAGGLGSIFQIIIQVIKMMKGSPAASRSGFIEEQLGAYFTPDQITQLMAAADEDEKEPEEPETM